ncbi:beta-lactamase family protein [Dyadobacter sp. CY261]|uniref:serine hydrolase domain-containing protein n=1 Tax=Dyadobacter sp. CY261 TaxID=2907203 RepID=UPI001F3735A9|nr:serine hydrolase domain-containing protein [Dyadobacter sp. CY261]MCF0074278.1 beta-lactamase family protein [Dyadobacter sp. CY261]
MIRILFLGSSIFIISFECARSQDFESKIDSLFQCYSHEKPGGQLAVSRDGRMIYSKAWGIADLESNAPLSKESLIEAGSVSKQFTAAAVLLAERQGLLKLDDPVNKYIPELPIHGKPILIRHLIHHTSGLREWSDIAEFAGWPEVLRVPNNGDVLNIICRQQSMNSVPGTEFRYSNSNYILLTIIITRASGMSFSDFTMKYIFQPAGMTHSSWRDDFGKVIPNRSKAYEVKNGKFRISMPDHSIHGAGGLLTTAEDLVSWNEFYLSAKMGNEALYDKQTALDTLNDKSLNHYAAGLFIDSRSTRKPVFFHGGATNAYRAKLIASPAGGLSIAWLSNTSMLDTVGIDPAAAVFDLLTTPDEQVAPQVMPVTAVKMDQAKLKSYAGYYKSAQSARDVEITMDSRGLQLSDTPLDAISERQFRFHGIELSFNHENELTVASPTGEPMQYHKVDTTVSNMPLDQFIGTYFSGEVGAEIKIWKNNNSLEIVLVSGATHPLESYARDRFLIPGLKADLTFKRNGKNNIDALELSTQRSIKVLFKNRMPRQK